MVLVTLILPEKNSQHRLVLGECKLKFKFYSKRELNSVIIYHNVSFQKHKHLNYAVCDVMCEFG